VTLHDRLLHHHTTGLSTVEVSSVNASRLVGEFESYYSKAQNSPTARYKTYVIKGSNHPDKMKMLSEWLAKHQIEFGKGASGNRKLTGFSYQKGTNGSVSIGSDDMIISAYQPKSNLVTAFFEPNPSLVDSMTYDITAWAVPYMYDLEAYALTERVNVTSPYSIEAASAQISDGKSYAYVAAYETLNDVKWMASLLNKGVKIRVAEKDFSVDGQSFRKGALVVLRWDNEHLEGYHELVREATNEFGQDTKTIKTGLVNLGKDFGSRYYTLIEAPKVAVLSGSEVS
ncbi:MAG: zinc carboxypeptidase, partial [Saprospiraceae bacterium]|nr:zinc carboxypeptidase [Saprospiraceae bacterium]